MSRTLPQGFIDALAHLGRPDITGPLLDALRDTDPSVAVRANTRRGAALASGGERVPWLPDSGTYLDSRPNFALDPAWHQGLYYVQDASSMAFTAIVRQLADNYFDGHPILYLDACAAPGGKSIAAAEGLPAGSCILANEYDPRRASILAENIAKYGMANTAVSQGDTTKIASLGPIFDIVAVDAPCSGEGMMRKEPEAIAQWSTGLTQSCAKLQRQIITDCWTALRPGGVMLFSTCTFNRTENEENLAFIVENLGGMPLELPCAHFPGVVAGIATDYPCYRFMPGHVRGEGLFVAAVRKPADDSDTPRFPKPSTLKAPDAEAYKNKVLTNGNQYYLRQAKDGTYYAIDNRHSGLFDHLAGHLRLLACGVPLCVRKGKDLAPTWQLAFSEALAGSSFATIGLYRAAALSYLHGESMTDIPPDLPKGFAIASYAGSPLGFIKNIGRRANNLYPDSLRLRISPDKWNAPGFYNIINV